MWSDCVVYGEGEWRQLGAGRRNVIDRLACRFSEQQLVFMQTQLREDGLVQKRRGKNGNSVLESLKVTFRSELEFYYSWTSGGFDKSSASIFWNDGIAAAAPEDLRCGGFSVASTHPSTSVYGFMVLLRLWVSSKRS